MPTPKLTAQILEAAILGMESQKEKLDAQIAELRQMLEGAPDAPATNPEVGARKRKNFSAATRRRMKEAQRLRWAKIRGESEPIAPAKPESTKPKRRLSKAGKAAIVAALKKRWAAKKAAAKTQRTKKTARKKAAVKKAVTKKVAVKKSAARKTAPAAAQTAAESAAQ